MGVNGNLIPLGKTAISKVRETPLSNDTMARRVDIHVIAKDLEDQLVAKNASCEAFRLAHQRHVQTMLSYKNLGKSFYRVTQQIIDHQSNKRTGLASQFISTLFVSKGSPDDNC